MSKELIDLNAALLGAARDTESLLGSFDSQDDLEDLSRVNMGKTSNEVISISTYVRYLGYDPTSPKDYPRGITREEAMRQARIVEGYVKVSHQILNLFEEEMD